MNTEQAIKHPMEHRLKCWPEYFKAVKDGLKPFEIRKWDRTYAVGDTVTLEEWNPEIGDYSGDAIVREITYVLDMTYLPGDKVPHFAGYAALGLSNPTAADALRAQQERENPQPLTVEELKERVNKPVWINFKGNEKNGWFVIRLDASKNMYIWDGVAKWGLKHWDIYDHEPKEAIV